MCSCASGCFWNSLGMITHLPFMSTPSITARSSLKIQYGFSSCVIYFCLVTYLIWCSLLAALGDHPGLLLIVYLLATCILGCLLLFVLHKWLSSCHLCFLLDSVMTTSQLWRDLVQACIGWILYWQILSSICDSVAIYLKIATSGLWSIMILTSLANQQWQNISNQSSNASL